MFNVYVKRNRSSSSSRSPKKYSFQKLDTSVECCSSIERRRSKKKKKALLTRTMSYMVLTCCCLTVFSHALNNRTNGELSALNFARRILPSLDWATSLRLKDKSGMLAQL